MGKDFEIIDKFNDNNSNILNFELNDELYNEVVKNMPQNMTNIEKTIYIYLKLCTLLTYDEEYYASKQDDEVNKRHIDISKLSDIDLSNNEVICYEFNAIFAKILDRFGYKFKIQLQSDECLEYGHTSLYYICDEYVISADSVTSILCGDLQLAKRGKMPVGLKCLNNSSDICREFNYALEEMTELIKDQTYKTNSNFRKILDEYLSLTQPKQFDISINRKIEMFFELLFKSNLTGMDAIGYITTLVMGIFDENVKKCMSVTIVTENIDNHLKPTVIFTINNDINDYNNNIYICFNPPNNLRRFNRDEMQNLFDNKNFVFRDKVVPGIIGGCLDDIRKY